MNQTTTLLLLSNQQQANNALIQQPIDNAPTHSVDLTVPFLFFALFCIVFMALVLFVVIKE